jgi:hypothetical protein
VQDHEQQELERERERERLTFKGETYEKNC